jgi:DNA gyrase subunit A
MMITARGKIQRIAVSDISILGRNTQGVRIMTLDQEDELVAVKRIPPEEKNEENGESDVEAPTGEAPPSSSPAEESPPEDENVNE